MLHIALFLSMQLLAQPMDPYEPPAPFDSCRRVTSTIRAFRTTNKMQDIESILKAKGINIADIQFPEIDNLPDFTVIDVNRLPSDIRADFKQIEADVKTSMPKSLARRFAEATGFGILLYAALNTSLAIPNYVYFNEHWIGNTISNLSHSIAVIPAGMLFYSVLRPLLSFENFSIFTSHPTDKDGAVYLMIEGEKTYEAYRRIVQKIRKKPYKGSRHQD